MAQTLCDICSNPTELADGYVVETADVVNEPYWKFFLTKSHMGRQAFINDPVGQSAPLLIQLIANQTKPWLVCEHCMTVLGLGKSKGKILAQNMPQSCKSANIEQTTNAFARAWYAIHGAFPIFYVEPLARNIQNIDSISLRTNLGHLQSSKLREHLETCRYALNEVIVSPNDTLLDQQKFNSSLVCPQCGKGIAVSISQYTVAVISGSCRARKGRLVICDKIGNEIKSEYYTGPLIALALCGPLAVLSWIWMSVFFDGSAPEFFGTVMLIITGLTSIGCAFSLIGAIISFYLYHSLRWESGNILVPFSMVSNAALCGKIISIVAGITMNSKDFIENNTVMQHPHFFASQDGKSVFSKGAGNEDLVNFYESFHIKRNLTKMSTPRPARR